jgi:hypothetical protein
MAVIIIWSFILLFIAWAAWAIQDEVRTYIQKATPFESKEFGFSFRYPSWWGVNSSDVNSHKEFIPESMIEFLDKNKKSLVFYDSSAEGRLRIFSLKDDTEITTKNDFKSLVTSGPVELDESEIEEIKTDQMSCYEIESRASIVIDEEPQRRFVRYNLVSFNGSRLFWVYDCGVLAGLVDGIFLRKTLKSLKSFA